MERYDRRSFKGIIMPTIERRAADKNKNMVTISVRMTTEDHILLTREADKEMRSLSNLLLVLAKRGIKRAKE